MGRQTGTGTGRDRDRERCDDEDELPFFRLSYRSQISTAVEIVSTAVEIGKKKYPYEHLV